MTNLLPYVPDYSFTMRDAHRKPFQAVGTPAITRHLAFKNGAPDELIGAGNDQRIEAIERFILACFDQLGGEAGAELSNLRESPKKKRMTFELLWNSYSCEGGHKKEEKSPERLRRYNTVVIKGHWHGLQVWLRFELFEEYFTLTITIDLSRSTLAKVQTGPLKYLLDAVTTLASTISERMVSLAKNPMLNLPKRQQTDEFKEATENVYRRICDQFAREVLKPALDDEQVVRLQPLIGKIFADFRGLILATQEIPRTEDNPTGVAIRGLRSGDDDTANLRLRVRGAPFSLSPLQEEQWVEAIFPILLLDCKDEEFCNPFECTEYTFSKLSTDRCLFGTGFGPQQVSQDEPLTYVALFTHDERRQIGRTVGRIHTLGTTRLAALFGLADLRTHESRLADIENRLKTFEAPKTLRQLLTETLDELTNVSELNLPQADRLTLGEVAERVRVLAAQSWNDIRVMLPRELANEFRNKMEKSTRRELRELSSKLAEIARTVVDDEPSRRIGNLAAELLLLAQADRDNVKLKQHALNDIRTELMEMDESVHSGISYRRARSLYNQRIFRKTVRAMRITRIEGFQPYNQFVELRLVRSYGVLAAIADRHRQLSHREDELQRRLLAERSMIYQEKIARFQRNAETGLVFLLAPYYFIATLDHAVPDFVKSIGPTMRSLIVLGVMVVLAVALELDKRRGRQKAAADAGG